ncbi:hypothetical protein BMMGA3_07000 [Bacillus methanolicus MGA3]|uniref:Uncharacterized protein n=1 Tax=Bacillus methanolicus (strain MGA3 / ATCC 53907) TaxID=796606 RepID=A0A068LPZ3_BACMM|nr:hypothetical protein BMMGA3_07000 [Bacillus methanolicus MGA3]
MDPQMDTEDIGDMDMDMEVTDTEGGVNHL